jgi:hypothetical protein
MNFAIGNNYYQILIKKELKKNYYTDLRIAKVTIAIIGAAMANIIKCFRTRALSSPSCIKKETKPKAAGA